MADIPADAHQCAQLARTEQALELEYCGECHSISREHAARCTVLMEVMRNSAYGDLVPLPVPGQLVRLWLAYAEAPAEEGYACSNEILVATVQAADMLGDAEATRDLASELAARLFPKPTEDQHLLETFMFDGSDDVWDLENFPVKEGTIRAAAEKRAAYSKQVLDQLSDDLVVSVMRTVPELSTLFRSLSPSMHAIALRARLPSIDAAHTLAITVPDGVTAAHTARAAAALTRLTSLSLTVSGHRFTHRLASFQRVLRALGDLPCAASLGVADALPVGGDLPALVLRQHMQSLGRLTRLAISPKSLLPGLDVIAPHFSGLFRLHTLDMSTPGSWTLKSADELAVALGALGTLRDLSLCGITLADSGWATISHCLSSVPLTALRIARCDLGGDFLLLGSSRSVLPVSSSTENGLDAGACTGGEHDPDAPTSGAERGPTYAAAGVSGHNACNIHAPCATPKTLREALVVLDLSGNNLESLAPHAACFDQLQSLSSLQTLALGRPSSREDEVDVLCAAGPGAKFSLRDLDASRLRHTALTASLCAALRVHAGLTALCLEGSSATPGVAEAIRGLAMLRELRLGNCEALLDSQGLHGGWRPLVRALGALTALQLLDLHACGLDTFRTVALTQELTGLQQLKALDLSQNAIRRQGAMAVVAWVHTLPLLRVLRMRRTDVSTGVQHTCSAQLRPRVKLSW